MVILERATKKAERAGCKLSRMQLPSQLGSFTASRSAKMGPCGVREATKTASSAPATPQSGKIGYKRSRMSAPSRVDGTTVLQLGLTGLFGGLETILLASSGSVMSRTQLHGGGYFQMSRSLRAAC